MVCSGSLSAFVTATDFVVLDDLHVVVISTDGERKAAVDGRVFRHGIRVLQAAAGKHCLLRVVESDLSEFLPVADNRLVGQNLVDGELTLMLSLVSYCKLRGDDLSV